MVVIAIGADYRAQYGRLFEPSHRRYCDRHGYDLFVVDRAIEHGGENVPVGLQRLLMCSLPSAAAYSHVVHTDADVLIHRDAPSLLKAIGDTNSVAVVDEFSQPSPILRLGVQKRRGWSSARPIIISRPELM